jgi:hypothetical protein
MWYRIEANTKKCDCGGTAELWVLLAGAKPLNQAFICTTCHPQLADYMSRQSSTARPRESAGAGGETSG